MHAHARGALHWPCRTKSVCKTKMRVQSTTTRQQQRPREMWLAHAAIVNVFRQEDCQLVLLHKFYVCISFVVVVVGFCFISSIIFNDERKSPLRNVCNCSTGAIFACFYFIHQFQLMHVNNIMGKTIHDDDEWMQNIMFVLSFVSCCRWHRALKRRWILTQRICFPHMCVCIVAITSQNIQNTPWDLRVRISILSICRW